MPGSPFDPTLLTTFLATLDAGRISAAAKAIHLSQPAVTAQLRKLEDALGTALFIRSVHGVTPTEAGLEHAPSSSEPSRRQVCNEDRRGRSMWNSEVQKRSSVELSRGLVLRSFLAGRCGHILQQTSYALFPASISSCIGRFAGPCPQVRWPVPRPDFTPLRNERRSANALALPT